MNVLNNLFSNELIEAAGFTFLHSLWQIALIALCLKCLLSYLHQPKIRCLFSLGALGLVLMSVVFTFYLSYPAYNNKTSNQTTIIEHVILDQDKITEQVEITKPTFDLNYLKTYFPILFNMWLLGFLYLSLKNILGLWYLKRLKRETLAVPESLKNIVKDYKTRLNIAKNITIVASNIVQSPAVVGFFKPVILIPIQLLSGTSYDYLKAIIAHEVAHIYRYDFLINIIQSIVTTIFYYHPGIWWINNQINVAREQSCDDIAIQLCYDRLLYGKALLQVSEMQTPKLVFAQHFYQNKKNLFDRIERLIKKPNKKTNNMEKLIAICLIVCALVTFAFGINQQNKQQKAIGKSQHEINNAIQQEKHKSFNIQDYKMYKYGSVTCTGEDFEYELEVRDGVYYYEDEVISLKPNRTVTIKTETGAQKFVVNNDSLHFINADEVRTCWSHIEPTYKKDLTASDFRMTSNNLNGSSGLDSMVKILENNFSSIKDNDSRLPRNKIISLSGLDSMVKLIENEFSISGNDSRLSQNKITFKEDYDNMTITPIGDGFEYNIEVKDGVYYYKDEVIPLQPDRTETLDTEDGPRQLIIENDSVQFVNALAIKYNWGGEYYKVQHVNRDEPTKIINDSSEEKQKPNYVPIFSNKNISIDEAYQMVFENFVSEQLIENGLISKDESYTFFFTNNTSQLNGVKLDETKHQQITEFYKSAYQTEAVSSDINIDFTVE